MRTMKLCLPLVDSSDVKNLMAICNQILCWCLNQNNKPTRRRESGMELPSVEEHAFRAVFLSSTALTTRTNSLATMADKPGDFSLPQNVINKILSDAVSIVRFDKNQCN